MHRIRRMPYLRGKTGLRPCPGGSSAARIGAQTTTGGVVVVAHSSAMGFSSAWPAAAWITARIHQDPRDTALAEVPGGIADGRDAGGHGRLVPGSFPVGDPGP